MATLDHVRVGRISDPHAVDAAPEKRVRESI